MRKSRSVLAGLWLLLLLAPAASRLGGSASGVGRLTRSGAACWGFGETHDASVPAVTLRSASGAIIRFESQNGATEGISPSVATDIPHLVLRRDDRLADPAERTLIIEVSAVPVPPEGVTVTLSAVTQRPNPDASGGGPIPVWHTSERIVGSPGVGRANGAALFTRTFTETVMAGCESIDTPTDYFRVVVTVGNDTSADGPKHVVGIDYAFLLENQWVVDLPQVREEAPGAAPNQLIIHYCDMVPFGGGAHERSTQLGRSDVSRFVGHELAPQMVEAYRLQTEVWGFPWPAAWTSLRPEDGAERLSVALTDGHSYYHGRAPFTGHSMISLNVSGGEGRHLAYDRLIDALMSTFHHELFHNLQWGIQQAYGGDGLLGGRDEAWQLFSEGTAVLASSVAQPIVHFAPGAAGRRYVLSANLFPARNVYSTETVTPALAAGFPVHGSESSWFGVPRRAFDPSNPEPRSFQTMPPPAAAIYWRLLYEQCGGMVGGIEDPADGMTLIRRALTVLYSGEVVDIAASTDLVARLPAIMDRALAGSSCPFQTHEESLLHLARAIYAWRLEGGRCTGPGLPAGCGLYDPNGLYQDPPVRVVTYNGVAQQNPILIRSSYGMVFLDVLLDPAVDGQTLRIEFAGAPEGEAEFRVQVWRLVDTGGGNRPRPIVAQALAPEVLTGEGPDGRLVYTIPAIDVAQFNRLGLIITRVDAKESSDPIGEYTIRLGPGTGRGLR